MASYGKALGSPQGCASNLPRWPLGPSPEELWQQTRVQAPQDTRVWGTCTQAHSPASLHQVLQRVEKSVQTLDWPRLTAVALLQPSHCQDPKAETGRQGFHPSTGEASSVTSCITKAVLIWIMEVCLFKSDLFKVYSNSVKTGKLPVEYTKNSINLNGA